MAMLRERVFHINSQLHKDLAADVLSIFVSSL